MNSFPLLILVLCNFVAIGLLPVMFFRQDGTYNLRWLATGAPFFIAPLAILAGYLGFLNAFEVPGGTVTLVREFIAVILCALSIGLIALTVGGHRVPLALWHQDNDAPASIVTWGAYSKIRHPFYTSFLMAFLAGVIVFPHAITAFCLLYSAVALTVTAKREERRLLDSEFGDEYRSYMETSGRFVPRMGS